MYEEYCLPTDCDNIVSCIKTISVPSIVCVSAPSFELHKPEYPSCGATNLIVGVLLFSNCGVLWSKNRCGDVVM